MARVVWRWVLSALRHRIQKINRRHFGLPPSSINRMIGLGGNFVQTMTHSHMPRFGAWSEKSPPLLDKKSFTRKCHPTEQRSRKLGSKQELLLWKHWVIGGHYNITCMAPFTEVLPLDQAQQLVNTCIYTSLSDNEMQDTIDWHLPAKASTDLAVQLANKCFCTIWSDNRL